MHLSYNFIHLNEWVIYENVIIYAIRSGILTWTNVGRQPRRTAIVGAPVLASANFIATQATLFISDFYSHLTLMKPSQDICIFSAFMTKPMTTFYQSGHCKSNGQICSELSWRFDGKFACCLCVFIRAAEFGQGVKKDKQKPLMFTTNWTPAPPFVRCQFDNKRTNLPATHKSASHPQTKEDRFTLMRPQADNLRALNRRCVVFFLQHSYQHGDCDCLAAV